MNDIGFWVESDVIIEVEKIFVAKKMWLGWIYCKEDCVHMWWSTYGNIEGHWNLDWSMLLL